MKEIHWVFLLLSIKSTLGANLRNKPEDFGGGSPHKEYKQHLSQPWRTRNEQIISQNETFVTLSSGGDAEVDNNERFVSPNDRKSDTSGPNDSLIVVTTSTVDTPVHAALVQNNSGSVPLGGKCSYSSKCSGKFVECRDEVCACITGYESHQNICVESPFVRLRESCNESSQCIGQFTICKRGFCSCFDGYFSSYENQDSCIERSLHPGHEVPRTDPTMIGVVIGLALMSVTLCVVMRLFAKARFRENRTIFNTANPRLMNVTLKKGSKNSRNQARRGSQASVQSGEGDEDSRRNERYADKAGAAGVTNKEPSSEGASNA